MLPPATAAQLNALGHEAVSVVEAGLAGADDAAVYALALDHQRVVVTENYTDFAVLARTHAMRTTSRVRVSCSSASVTSLDAALSPSSSTRCLDSWASVNPDPMPGTYWAT